MPAVFRVLKGGAPLLRPVIAETVHDARRRVLASLGLELEPCTLDEFEAAEQRCMSSGGLPAVSEACEPNEEITAGSPCFGLVPGQCRLKEKCARWLYDARGMEPER